MVPGNRGKCIYLGRNLLNVACTADYRRESRRQKKKRRRRILWMYIVHAADIAASRTEMQRIVRRERI